MPPTDSSKSDFQANSDQGDNENAMDDAPSLHAESSVKGSSDSKESAFDKSFISKNGSLPEVISLHWVGNVLDVSWETVRKYAGLDAYFFLRYIRMNLRMCCVTLIWAFLLLVPTYATGYNNDQQGWYHMSVANVLDNSWRLWVPTIFAYLFSGFVFFVMKQEYRHFLELRMDFLAKGTRHHCN